MDRHKIIAVDFDGTLCVNKWPDIGEPIEPIIRYVRMEKTHGAKLILWTNRHGRELENAVSWCRERGITFDAVNENLPETIEYFGGDCRKVFANEYIDDMAVPPGYLIEAEREKNGQVETDAFDYVVAKAIKQKISRLADDFKRIYYTLPRYVILSADQASLLRDECSIYMNVCCDGEAAGDEFLNGMRVCVSDKISAIGDIEVF